MDNNELINKMIDDIIAGNNTEAKETFDSAIAAKMSDALDSKKVELAQSVYSKEKDEDPVSTEE